MLSVRSPPSLLLAMRKHHSRLVLLSTGQRRTFKTRSVGPRQNTTTPRRPDSVHLGVHVPAVRITGPAISLLNSRRPTSTAMMVRCRRDQGSRAVRQPVSASNPDLRTTSRLSGIVRTPHRPNLNSLPPNKAVAPTMP